MNNLFTKRNVCLVCGSSSLNVIWEEVNPPHTNPIVNKYVKVNPILIQCSNCQFAFVQSIPNNPEFYENLYMDSDRDVSIDFKFSGKLLIFKQIKESLNRFIGTGKRVCDIGAGTGTFIDFIKNEYSTYGIELSQKCVDFGRSMNLNLRKGDLSILQMEDSFDAITLIDVLEHLENPASTVSTLRNHLNNDGLLIIKVPNYKAQLIKQNFLKKMGLSREGIMQNYVHINHFVPDSLIFLLQANGFEILEVKGTPPEIWNLRWKDAPRSFTYRFFYNMLVRFISGIFNLMGPNTSLNFYITARKSEK